MKRGIILFIFLISIFLLSGCAVLRYLDGSSDEDIKTFNMSRKDLLREMANLQSVNETRKESLDRQQVAINKLDEQGKANLKAISERQAQIEKLEKEKVALLEENMKLKTAAAPKEDALVEMQAREKAQASAAVEMQTREKAQAAAAKKLRIKVLTGTGKFSAARELSKKIKGLGYKVEWVGRAPKSDFKDDIVYFAEGAKKEAKELADRLGEKTVVKPLTWSSIFDIIVVAGKNKGSLRPCGHSKELIWKTKHTPKVLKG